MLAALCGLMLMPLVLNFGFYRVLRQPFALWHALAVFAMLVQTFVASGLVNRFASLSIMQISLLSSISLSLASIAASQFIATLVEPGMLSRRSEEHTSELQSLMRNSYAVFCLKKKKKTELQALN